MTDTDWRERWERFALLVELDELGAIREHRRQAILAQLDREEAAVRAMLDGDLTPSPEAIAELRQLREDRAWILGPVAAAPDREA